VGVGVTISVRTYMKQRTHRAFVASNESSRDFVTFKNPHLGYPAWPVALERHRNG